MSSRLIKADEGLGKTLFCVEYPGVVQNIDKMLYTLGDLRTISTSFSEKNRRLELRFRPDDAFCKPACGDKHQISAILLRVKVKRRKTDEKEEITTETNIVGKINSVFRFNNLCDFQYLPMNAPPSNPSQMECIYKSLVPEGIVPLSWIYEPAIYFNPPAAFSRMDSVQGYVYRKDAPCAEGSIPHNVIGRTRRRRSIHAIFVQFDVEDVPKKPRDMALKLLQVKFLEESHLSRIKKLFEERPVWSKNALMCVTKFSSDQLKYLLPAAAYYFVTGPWRVMWVRFGYDPRKEVGARLYQTLDYRLRRKGGMKTKVKAKRSYTNNLLPYKLSPACQPKVVVISKDKNSIDPEAVPTKAKDDPSHYQENNYIFRPGLIPPSRQMFYQYCDVQVPDIQEMLNKLPPPLPDAKCHEREGWLPSGFSDQCREIINNIVMETLKSEAQFSDKVSDTSSSRKDQDVTDSSDSEGQDEGDLDEEDGDWEVDLDDIL